METSVELREVVKRFGQRAAVDHVSLAVARGQFYSLLGPSGCGKTTTLRLIAGFEQPDEGDVLILGERVNDLPPYRRKVSTVFQSYALFPHMTVAGNIEFGLRQARAPAEEMRRKVGRVLDLVGLPGAANRRPQSLSGGEKQRVALARSIVLEPNVLLLDEPLAALDEKLRREMRIELKRLQRAVGITFLFVTHDQEEALTLSDAIAVMNRGKIEQVGTPEEIYQRPRTRFVAEFIGSSNLIPVRGSAGALLVRPEAVHIADGTIPAGVEQVTGRVVHSVFLGPQRQVIVEVEPGVRMTVLTPASTSIPLDSRVELWWNPEDAVILSE
ncbi:MAG: ABC transporter ATP-binding protein [Acidobacteria bacterium]|nr:ABC transporter ATP-binding protein [Acidobacteriota bacterium]